MTPLKKYIGKIVLNNPLSDTHYLEINLDGLRVYLNPIHREYYRSSRVYDPNNIIPVKCDDDEYEIEEDNNEYEIIEDDLDNNDINNDDISNNVIIHYNYNTILL